MEQVIDFISNLFGTESWPPRWHCGRWTDFHGWLYINSDLAIWLAYFAIPVYLIKFVTKKRDVPLPSVFWLFGAFILLCGLTHLVDALMFWWPAYRLNALVRFVTACISWLTVFSLIKVLPQAFALKTTKQLEAEITERKKVEKQLRESEKLFKGLLESAPDSVVIADKHGKIIFINNQTERLFGYAKDELIGKEVEFLIPKRFQNQHPEHRSNYFTEPKVRSMGAGLELFGIKKNGVEFPVEISLSPLLASDGMIVTAAIRDITERKKVERKLDEYTIQLESKNKELEQFAYVASHDLQEPLRSISNFSTLLTQKLESNPDNETREYISFINRGAKRMSKLIFDLLEYSRIGKDRSKLQIDCNKLMNEILTDMSASIKESGAEIHIEKLPVVNGYIYLKSVFQNLISNAIVFRKEETYPVITISASDRGTEFLFSVKDNGIGIETIYHERIFIIFQRLHTRQKYSGTGIGLSQCRKIIELHGGKIWVESEPDKGSTFKFTIPKT